MSETGHQTNPFLPHILRRVHSSILQNPENLHFNQKKGDTCMLVAGRSLVHHGSKRRGTHSPLLGSQQELTLGWVRPHGRRPSVLIDRG